MASRYDKIAGLVFVAGTFASFAISSSHAESVSADNDTVAAEITFPTSTENLTLDDIDDMVDEFLALRQQGHPDSSFFANDLLLFISEHRENDKKKVSIILLKMYQNNDAESSGFIRQMLNEMFYFDPQIVATALAEIEDHLLEEFRNARFVDHLIDSACGIPQIITEDVAFNNDALRADAIRIISEIEELDINSTVRTKIIEIVESWM